MGATPDPLFYLEHRSRHSDYPPGVDWMWQVGHILRALQGGRVDEARARACLALAYGEQTSMDKGSRTLAWEHTLLPVPPYSSFARHAQSPDLLPHSRLIDPRWLEVALGRLKELDDLRERRQRLAAASGGPQPAALQPSAPVPPGQQLPQQTQTSQSGKTTEPTRLTRRQRAEARKQQQLAAGTAGGQ